MSLRSQGTGAPALRHIPYTYSDSSAFGDHYITQDPALQTAPQFDITVFPRGDDRRPAGDPLRTAPHVRIRTYDGQTRTDVSATPIGKG